MSQMDTPPASAREIARARMANLGLTSAPAASLEDVVGTLGALQAQEYAFAKWSVAQRTAGATEDAVQRAVAEGRILRTHLLRPTWHFVLPADIRWILALTGPRIQASSAYRYGQLALDDAQRARSAEAIAEALAGGRHLTRKELAAVLEEAGISTEGQRLPHILMHAELEGVICSGAPRGKRQTYALLAERAPDAPTLSREEALAALTRRYLATRGPATALDYRAWSSLLAADARAGLALLGDEAASFDLDGRTYWWMPGAASPPAPPPPAPDAPAAHLLQTFDEFFSGYRESKDVADVDGWLRAVGGEIGYYHAVVIDGQLVGRWRRKVRARDVQVDISPLRPLDPAEEEAVDAAVARYGEFLGLQADWRVTDE